MPSPEPIHASGPNSPKPYLDTEQRAAKGARIYSELHRIGAERFVEARMEFWDARSLLDDVKRLDPV